MKIDLGCGNNKPGSDWIGIDVVDTSDADIVHDLVNDGMPYGSEIVEKGCADVVRMNHFLEHVDDVEGFLQEVAVLGGKGCEVRVNVPHYLCVNAADADHENLFSEISLDTFCVNHDYPTPRSQLFEMQSVDFVFNHGRLIRLVRFLLGDAWVRQHIPNSVEEIRYKLEVVRVP